MPIIAPDYPPGYDPYQSQVNEYRDSHDQMMAGLIAVGAFSAVGVNALLLTDRVVGEVLALETASVAEIHATTDYSMIEKMIAEELIAEGKTAEEVQAFINRAAAARIAANGIGVMGDETAEAIAIMNYVQTHHGEVQAAIALAAALVNEQEALHLFFTSGL